SRSAFRGSKRAARAANGDGYRHRSRSARCEPAAPRAGREADSPVSRARSVYGCTECGAPAATWAGQCSAGGAWNALTEMPLEAPAKRGRLGAAGGKAEAQPLGAIVPESIKRLATGLGELDRVLGGGLVPGSVVLLGGDPGIGKSTLLIQALAQIGR